MSDDQEQRPESLLPYDQWQSDAMRQVMVRALRHAAEQGLPGEHHFYITFRTDAPGVKIPARLLAQYPSEMTIVLQHQFWDLAIDAAAGWFDVSLSFSGIPSPLHIPFAAVVAFADPHANYGMRFIDPVAAQPAPEPQPAAAEPPRSDVEAEPPQQVVSLDAFRRRTPPAGRDN